MLYATGNPAKLKAMERCLKPLGIELSGLGDVRAKGADIPQVEESGATPLENARIKAEAYYKAFRVPVFSCDSGLYYEGAAKKEQPGVCVRTVNGKSLTDDQVRMRIINAVKTYGEITAYYKHAICFIAEEGKMYEIMDESTESKRFVLTDTPHSSGNKGFPIDSLSVDIETGMYFYDLPKDEVDKLAIPDGVIQFFADTKEKLVI